MTAASLSGGARILVADDDPDVADVVRRALEREGMAVDLVADGRSALARLAAHDYDLLVLDLEMPVVGGFDVLEEVRRRDGTAVIVLSGRAGEGDRVLGLELGADDYVAKPFSHRELVARVRSVLRRTGQRAAARIEHPGLVIDLTSREVTAAGAPVDLTAKEFDLLVALAESPRRVFTREDLLRLVWRSSGDWQSPATVTEHIRRLRHKLGPGPDGHEWITTRRSVGYRFEPPAS